MVRIKAKPIGSVCSETLKTVEFFAVGKIEPLMFDLSWPRPRLPSNYPGHTRSAQRPEFRDGHIAVAETRCAGGLNRR